MVTKEILHAVIDELSTMISESKRANDIVLEAASTLRQNFMTLAEASNPEQEQLAEKTAEAHRQCISSLQFDDIVSQILQQQINRGEATKKLLSESAQLLGMLPVQSIDEQTSIVIREILYSLRAHKNNPKQANSVRQENLEIGSVELF